MKKEFSAIEIKFLTEELKELENSKIDRIYQPEKDILIIQTHKTGTGRRILRIQGKLMYLTEHKPENPQTPLGFCTYLRKKISNSVIKSIMQVRSERVIEILLDAKESQFSMVIELFGSGNIILVQESKILSPMNIQKFKDRDIRPGQDYAFPQKNHNLFEIDEDKFSELLSSSGQESIVKALALDIGLGGIYAEELCLLSSTDKNQSPGQAPARELYSLLRSLIKKKPEARIIEENGCVIDIVPFCLEKYKGHDQRKADSFNKALDSVLTCHHIVKDKEQAQKTACRDLEKIKNSIKLQEKNIEKLKRSADDDKIKAEAIYEKYSDIKEILDELGKAGRKHGWKEVKKRLKDHKIIKEINEKEGKIVIDIG